MNFKELRQQSGMTQRQFADYFGIPKRTIENWEAGVNKCPEYLLDLMKYKLNLESNIYLITLDNSDSYHENIHVVGYIIGTEADASAYCSIRDVTRSEHECGEFLYEKIRCLATDE